MECAVYDRLSDAARKAGWKPHTALHSKQRDQKDFHRTDHESGEGYSDILIRIESEDIGIIIEVKYAENGRFDYVCAGAVEQIRKKGYTSSLEEEGCQTIFCYGIACYRKKCRVMMEVKKEA